MVEQALRKEALSHQRGLHSDTARSTVRRASSGQEDIAAGNLTITAERASIVDFAAPSATNIKEVLARDQRHHSSQGSMISPHRRDREALQQLFHTSEGDQRTAQAVGKSADQDRCRRRKSSGRGSARNGRRGLLPWVVVDRHKAVAWSGLLKASRSGRHHDQRRRRVGLGHTKGQPAPDQGAQRVRRRPPARNGVRQQPQSALRDNAKSSRMRAEAKQSRRAGTRRWRRYSIASLRSQHKATRSPASTGRCDTVRRGRHHAVQAQHVSRETDRHQRCHLTAEDNIHAGAKYLRFLADTYIAEPAVAAREQVLMALAAYTRPRQSEEIS